MRRKGEATDRARNRSHPFQVEMVVPGTGLGNALDIMYRWASQFDHVTTRPKEPGQGSLHLMRWCFQERALADAFATDFGGRRVDLPVDPSSIASAPPDRQELERRARAATTGLVEREAASELHRRQAGSKERDTVVRQA